MPALTLDIVKGRAVLTLTNPSEGNRMNAAFMQALAEALHSLERRSDYRTLTLQAEGPQFCVGGDIGEFLAAPSFAGHIRDTLPAANELFARLAALPVPVIAAIQGAVAGGGLGLALSADILVASENAAFRSAYPAIGVSPDLGSSYQVLRRAGPTFAMEFLMSNRRLSAAEALVARLITEVVPQDRLAARVDAIAEDLDGMPPASLAAIKRLVSAPGDSLPAHMALETAEIVACAATGDAAEGIAAFAEKRPPKFSRT